VLVEGPALARRRQPLTLLASKSWVGHSEPGAGVVGVMHAHVALSRRAALPVTHLRAVNPYVASSMDMSGAAGGLAGGGWRVAGTLGRLAHECCVGDGKMQQP
jgi:3-oxoacyl-(acyl-carrier-protein) synthase